MRGRRKYEKMNIINVLKESDRERLEGVCRDVIGSREEQKLMSAESAAEDPKKEDQKG